MRIGILGAGNIGGSLGVAWAKAGHTVHLGVRDPQKPETQTIVQQAAGQVSAGRPPEAAAFGEVCVLAIPAGAVSELLATLGDRLDGRLVIDATNNIRGPGPLSAVALIAERAPQAQVYRAFNSIGWENIQQPRYGQLQADMLFCGPDGPGRQTVASLIADAGFQPLYVGDLTQLEVVDNLTRLWFALVRGQGYGRRVAFKVLTEADERP